MTDTGSAFHLTLSRRFTVFAALIGVTGVLVYGIASALLWAGQRQIAMIRVGELLVARAASVPLASELVLDGHAAYAGVLYSDLDEFDTGLDALLRPTSAGVRRLVLGALQAEVDGLVDAWAPIRRTRLPAGTRGNDQVVAAQVRAHATDLQAAAEVVRNALVERFAWFRRLIVLSAAFSVSAFLAILVVAVRSGRRRLAGPAASLEEATRRIKRGEFGYQVPIEGNDELSSLAHSFNEMSSEMARLAVVEEELRQSQKMEAIGQLVGGIAHDVNNALTAIRGYNDMLIEQLDASKPIWGDLRQIDAATTRTQALMDKLLTFARRRVLLFEPVSIESLLKDMIGLLGPLLGERIDLQLTIQANLPSVRADRHQLEHVLVNLALNARDAMPNGGALRVSATLERRPPPPQAHGSDHARPYVRLDVQDTGMGMDEQTQARVFEPFFTTKGEGQGTGLGLATAHSTVSQLGGFILVESVPDAGSTFSVYLPLGDGHAGSATPVATSFQPVEVGRETILLVEDDAAVRTLATTILTRHGYYVYAATNGREAVEIDARLKGRVDLVLTDVVMPGMDGPALVRELRATRDQVRVLYMSAYGSGDLRKSGIPRGDDPLIKKPFTVRTFLQTVRKTLDRVA